MTDAYFVIVFLVTRLELQVDSQARELYLEFSNWILTHMRDIWILRLGFCTEFRATSIQQSGLAWGAILEKMAKYCET